MINRQTKEIFISSRTKVFPIFFMKVMINVGKHIRRKKRGWILFLLLLMWVIFTFASVRTWSQSFENKEVIKENVVTCFTNYDYAVEVNPCTLYPEGGLITGAEVMFTPISKKINTIIEVELSSEKPVFIEGEHQIKLQLIAEEMWTKEFALTEKEKFAFNISKSKLVEEKFVLDFEEIKQFIAQVEEEIGMVMRTYYLVVKPELTGTLTYEGRTQSIQALSEGNQLRFLYNTNRLSIEGEKSFASELTLKKEVVQQQFFYLFGAKIPSVFLKGIFAGLSLLFLVVLCLFIWQDKSTQGTLSASEQIDKRYGSRLLQIKKEINTSGKTKICLASFSSLVQIADERELPILRFSFEKLNVVYFILDGDLLYYYLV